MSTKRKRSRWLKPWKTWLPLPLPSRGMVPVGAVVRNQDSDKVPSGGAFAGQARAAVRIVSTGFVE